jgi:EAL domain-containing protein (putative c-di-GMP-specific phosphodiesterase class I)
MSIANIITNIISEHKNLKFYRLQSDEFAVLAQNEEKDAFIDIIYKILTHIKSHNIMVEQEVVFIRCSCGISFESKENLFSTADMALKVAKKSNDDYIIFDESISLNQEYEKNIKCTRKLSNAIKQGCIITYYQPIVNNSDLSYEKYECLVRMIDGNRVISPYFFLEVAKQTRQYLDITKTVIYQSFEMFKDKEAEFSINLSIMDILEEQIVEYIFMMLEKYKIGSRVVFEIVESEYIENFEGVMSFINRAKKYNCKIAIVDFGTGYSNFEYIVKLKADYLKIDGSFIKNIDKDENAFLVVSTIVKFSKKLGMKIIAEFVENEKILKIVKDLGIDYSQGYYFSEPKRDI